jgi:hypothetical protein
MTVTLVGPDPSGLAVLIGDLIEQNLAREPDRRGLLRRSVAALEASDADVTVFVRVEPKEVRVGDGTVPDAHVRIRSDSDRLLGLTTVPLRFGLPDVTQRAGRAVLGDLLAGRVRIRGLVAHPVRLARLTMLLSVAEGKRPG